MVAQVMVGVRKLDHESVVMGFGEVTAGILPGVAALGQESPHVARFHERGEYPSLPLVALLADSDILMVMVFIARRRGTPPLLGLGKLGEPCAGAFGEAEAGVFGDHTQLSVRGDFRVVEAVAVGHPVIVNAQFYHIAPRGRFESLRQIVFIYRETLSARVGVGSVAPRDFRGSEGRFRARCDAVDIDAEG